MRLPENVKTLLLRAKSKGLLREELQQMTEEELLTWWEAQPELSEEDLQREKENRLRELSKTASGIT